MIDNGHPIMEVIFAEHERMYMDYFLSEFGLVFVEEIPETRNKFFRILAKEV